MGLTKQQAVEFGIEVPMIAATIPTVDAMNRSERKYADLLELRRRAGELWRFDYQSIKLRLADDTWYTPDFIVYLAEGTIEFHEVKGYWREDARVKFKVAAATFPFPFVAAKLTGSTWTYERLVPGRR